MAWVPIDRDHAKKLYDLAQEWDFSGYGARDALCPGEADAYFGCARELRKLLRELMAEDQELNT